MGTDVVGGIPHYELTREDGVNSVHKIFELAARYGRLIDVHCDEVDDPQSRFLEVMAACAIRAGNGPQVTASHTTAFGSYDNGYANKLLGFLKRSRINFVANPLINIALQGRTDTYPKRRGLTRVKELWQGGLNVSLGYDCIMDPWYALGTGNMLDPAHMAVHCCQMMGRAEIDACYDMVTWNGARTLGQQTALVLADARVGRLVEACRRAGILATTTFVVVSDHGFKTYKHKIRGNVVLKEHGLSDSAWAIAEGGTANVYVTGQADKAKTIEAIKSAFAGVEGVAEVLTPADYPRYGFPSPQVMPRMSDVVIAARDGYAFDAGVTGLAVETLPDGVALGAHGYLNTDPDLRAIFVASGAGVKRGAPLGVIHNIDVAPTIAAWLGLRMTNIEGHVLSGIVE